MYSSALFARIFFVKMINLNIKQVAKFWSQKIINVSLQRYLICSICSVSISVISLTMKENLSCKVRVAVPKLPFYSRLDAMSFRSLS